MKYLLFPALAVVLLFGSDARADLLAEFLPNPAGGDPAMQDFELNGAANSAFDLWILSIEGDTSSSTGLVDRASNVTGTYDAFGRAVVTIPDLENPSFTTVLSSGFTGAAGVTDIDTNDDGIADNIGDLGTLMDSLGVPDDDGSGTFLYGSQLSGVDFTYTGDEPRLVFRDGTTGDWYAVNDPDNGQVFNLSAIDVIPLGSFDIDPFTSTFGSVNPSFTPIPEPSFGVLGVFGIGGLIFRRRRK